MSTWLNKLIRRRKQIMKKYDVECVKAMLFLIAKDMREKNIKKQLMTIGKQLTAGDWEIDFDFDEAVRMSQDAASEYKELASTMQEEYEREKEEIINKANSPHSPADLDDDPVNPAHYMSYYKDGIDCITAMKHAFGEEAVQHFCITNAFKYIWRHMSKNGMQDIEKAVWYLNKYLELNK